MTVNTKGFVSFEKIKFKIFRACQRSRMVAMMKAIRWAIKHPRVLMRIYIYACLSWIAFFTLILMAWLLSQFTLINLAAAIIFYLVFIIPPLIPVYVLYYRSSKRMKPLKMIQLDPYLISVKEKIYEAESYFRGEKGILWSQVIILLYDAIMSTLQRLVIDIKGIKPIEQMRREKKLYFDNLISILRKEGKITSEEIKELEILRDLRNRVVHEDYRPSKEHASWAFEVTRAFIKKTYPEVFKKT